MKTLTWLKYDFTAELRPRVSAPGDSIVDEQFPPTGNIVRFTFRSNASTTLRVLAPEKFPLFSALVAITDKQGFQPFASEFSSEGDFWQIYHVEPIYDAYGRVMYWLHMAKRMS